MSKLSIEDVTAILTKQIPEKDRVTVIVKELEKLAEEKKQEREDEKGDVPKTKNEYLVVVVDDTNLIAAENRDKLTAFVVQQKVGADAGTVLSRLSDAAKEQNESRAGKKNPLKGLIEALGHLKRKFIKEKYILIKTKTPVRVLVSNGKLV